MDVFASNDAASFNIIAGTTVGEGGVAGTNYDSAYVTKGINASASTLRSPQFINPATGATVTLSDAWLHFEYNTGNQPASFMIAQLVDSAGTPVVRIMNTTNNTLRADYWNGAAWVTTGTAFPTGTSGKVTIDLHAVAGVSGSMNMYINNSLATTQTGLNAAVDNFAFLDIAANSTNPYHSQILVSDTNTIGAKVATITPNANGANTAWVNDYTSIVKNGFNDATLVSSSTLNDKETYAATDPSIPAGYAVSSLWFALRARLNTSAPANIKPVVRIAGVDYTGAYNFAALNTTTFLPSIAAYALDPTGGAWGAANLAAAEYGFITQT